MNRFLLLVPSAIILGMAATVALTWTSVWVDVHHLAFLVLLSWAVWTSVRIPLQALPPGEDTEPLGLPVRAGLAVLWAALAWASVVLSWAAGSMLLHVYYRYL